MRLWILAAIAITLAGGCVSAQFHSKTGRTFPQITPRAVILSRQEAGAVHGDVIGTITARGPDFKDQRDLADTAARVAAANGGTHVLVTREWETRRRYYHPASSATDCSSNGDGDSVSCQTTYEPANTTASAPDPHAEFVVLRVDPRYWSNLPADLRPVTLAADPSARTASAR